MKIGGRTQHRLKGGRANNHRGGQAGTPSAWASVFNTVGTQNQQVNNVNRSHNNGNMLRNMAMTQPTSVASKFPIQMRGGHKRTKRGGVLGGIVQAAAVPFGIWGLQHLQGKKMSRAHHSSSRSRRHRSRRHR